VKAVTVYTHCELIWQLSWHLNVQMLPQS